jgi:hypothetical protein
MVAVLAAVLVSLGAAAAGSAATTGYKWLTLKQARTAAKHPVNLVYCDDQSSGDGYCFHWTNVRLHMTSFTIRGKGTVRRSHGKRLWRKFLVNATCGSDQLSGRQFHARFIWEWDAIRLTADTSDPQSPDNTGVAQLGC